jgi:hypothetical protein
VKVARGVGPGAAVVAAMVAAMVATAASRKARNGKEYSYCRLAAIV